MLTQSKLIVIRDLVERLRRWGAGERTWLSGEAADAISSLLAEREVMAAELAEARAATDRIRSAAAEADLRCWGPAYASPEAAQVHAKRLRDLLGYPIPTPDAESRGLANELIDARADLARVTAERDAAKAGPVWQAEQACVDWITDTGDCHLCRYEAGVGCHDEECPLRALGKREGGE